MTRPSLPYDYSCFADSTPFEKDVSDVTNTAYTITYSRYFLFKWSTVCTALYNHMVGGAESFVSPFYSIPLGPNIIIWDIFYKK